MDRRINKTRYTYPGFQEDAVRARVDRINKEGLDAYLKDWKEKHPKWVKTLDWYLESKMIQDKLAEHLKKQ